MLSLRSCHSSFYFVLFRSYLMLHSLRHQDALWPWTLWVERAHPIPASLCPAQGTAWVGRGPVELLVRAWKLIGDDVSWGCSRRQTR